jgi:hypothetical protein
MKKSTSKKNVPKVLSTPSFKALKNIHFFYFKSRAFWVVCISEMIEDRTFFLFEIDSNKKK